ncbi:8685_t:CDS:2 [Dentiscutata erythropus]|uniref:8685_t:CDS:1 n=1 Tax=Dentiscutata erythropus TaxID=1348616 RepID=A0A9N9EEG1_9GLOM|nr:8685_t:CDS:2 [Dentiscutata erythropus]
MESNIEMDSPFLYYPLPETDSDFVYQYHPSYENNSVNEIQPSSFEGNKEKENSDYEDSDNEEHCDTDPVDKSIIRRCTFEYSYACIHEAEKSVLAENRRERAFGIQITSVVSAHNHPMNPLITEIAPRFHRLTDDMLEKIKFWTINGRLGMSIQYNLLTASFPGKKVNKKDLSNAIECYKKQLKP